MCLYTRSAVSPTKRVDQRLLLLLTTISLPELALPEPVVTTMVPEPEPEPEPDPEKLDPPDLLSLPLLEPPVALALAPELPLPVVKPTSVLPDASLWVQTPSFSSAAGCSWNVGRRRYVPHRATLHAIWSRAISCPRRPPRGGLVFALQT